MMKDIEDKLVMIRFKENSRFLSWLDGCWKSAVIFSIWQKEKQSSEWTVFIQILLDLFILLVTQEKLERLYRMAKDDLWASENGFSMPLPDNSSKNDWINEEDNFVKR